MLLDRFLFASHLHPHEKLVYVVHQHWAAVYRPVCRIGFFGLLIPALLYAMFTTPTALLIFGAWFGLGFLRFLYEVVDWYFDALLVTNLGIIDLDWKGIFDKKSARIDHETVVGVAYEKPGFWANVLNYGPLIVEKEGHGEEPISLPCVDDPMEAERQILLTREKCLHEKGLEDSEALKDILGEMIAERIRESKEEKHLADLL